MITRFMAFLAALFGWKTTLDESVPVPPKQPLIPLKIDQEEAIDAPPVEVPIITPKPPIMTKRERLYAVAKASIGKDMSPLDRAPDNLGCMESLDGVFYEAFGEHLLLPENRLSTSRGYYSMRKDPRLIQIPHSEILPGDISMAATGTSTKGALHGHVGIWGKETVMSNNSDTGLWGAHYTKEAWVNVFNRTLQFPLYAFRIVE